MFTNATQMLEQMAALVPGLSRKLRSVAEYILSHPDDVAFRTVEQLSKHIGVSPATVFRTANRLGFDGYTELQRQLRGFVSSRLNSFERLSDSTVAEGVPIYQKTIEADIRNLQETLRGLDESAFDRALEILVKAPRIYIVALRSTSSVGHFLQFGLQLIRNRTPVVLLTADSYVDHLVAAEPPDAVVGLSFRRYTAQTVQIMQYARERGLPLIGVTDLFSSPLAAISTVTLLAPITSGSFVGSYTAALSLINSLVNGVAHRDRKSTAGSLAALEAAWARLGIHTDPSQSVHPEGGSKTKPSRKR